MTVSYHGNNHSGETCSKRRVLLMGNPNVGKSVIFSTLTNKRVMTANYSGTTVTSAQGDMIGAKVPTALIDVPGVYSLKAASQAEKAAVDMLDSGADVIVAVLDATNLERNLALAKALKKTGIPVIFMLNMVDVAESRGIKIDQKKLEELLGAPVIKTVAVKRKGFNRLIVELNRLLTANNADVDTTADSAPSAATIAEEVITYTDYEERLSDKLERWTIKPFTGIPIAILIVFLCLAFVVGMGKAVRAALFLPLLNQYYIPFMERLAAGFTAEGTMMYAILAGEFGVLIKAVEWPIALILPYVFFFYIVLSFLEDSGYLPRLGIVIDGLLRKFGLHGHSIIPISMGYGCAVPAIIGTRTASSMKERLIVSALVSLAVPCIAQTGAFIALLGDHSFVLLLLIFFVSFIVMFISGSLLNKVLKGTLDPVLIEVPNLLAPSIGSLWKKVKMRTKHFMIEAEIPMVIGIVVAALTIETGVLEYVGFIVEPVVVHFLGLPPEASVALILGVIRRELAVLPLLGMDLSLGQMFVGSLVALLYIPCMSVFFVLIKEFQLRWALVISGATIVTAMIVGGTANYGIQILQWFMFTLGGGN